MTAMSSTLIRWLMAGLYALDLSTVDCQRLLAEHRLAAFEAGDRPLAMSQMRRGDVDGVNRVVSDQTRVGIVRTLDTELGRKRPSALAATTPYGDELVVR